MDWRRAHHPQLVVRFSFSALPLGVALFGTRQYLLKCPRRLNQGREGCFRLLSAQKTLRGLLLDPTHFQRC